MSPPSTTPYSSNASRLFLLGLILLFGFFYSQQLGAQNGRNSKKELENKKRRINEEIREINQMLGETKASRKSSMGALLNLNLKLQKRQELINAINSQLGHLNQDIRRNEDNVASLKASLDKLKSEYARMIRLAQRNQDAYSVLMFVFAAENFNQAYARLKYMQQYSEFRRKQALEIINTQTQLIAKLGELKEQRVEKNELLGYEQKEKKTLSAEKQEQEQVLTELQKKERQLKADLEKKRHDAAQLQIAIKRLIEEEIRRKAEEAARVERARLAAKKAKEAAAAAAAAKKNKASGTKPLPDAKTEKTDKVADKKDAMVPELSDEAVALSADFANNRGKLPWPVSKGVICETYGEHEHPAIKGFMMFNNGVDFCATRGSQARAVFDGEVTGIAVSPTGGKLVIIRHGEYLSVYTNLDEVLVKTGQKVSVKQPIGTVLSDEEEGKTLMNLQIWKGQRTMDPGGWLSGR
jgi:murein hydrolase activator